MFKKMDILSLEQADGTNKKQKKEFLILSRNSYNDVTNCYLVCHIEYTKIHAPYLIPILVKGLRQISKINTLSLEKVSSDNNFIRVGKISEVELFKITQALILNFTSDIYY